MAASNNNGNAISFATLFLTIIGSAIGTAYYVGRTQQQISDQVADLVRQNERLIKTVESQDLRMEQLERKLDALQRRQDAQDARLDSISHKIGQPVQTWKGWR